MKEILKTFRRLIDRSRDIYELAELFPQNRRPVSEYLEVLQDPESQSSLSLGEGTLKGNKTYPIKDDVPYFVDESDRSAEWKKLNEQFLNYHKSLSVFELVNSTPIINYVSMKTGLYKSKNVKVLDVGGGTGHTFCSFFHHPEDIEYFLLDPNLRLLHDQFIRIYPKLTYLKMAHIVAYAEKLPIKDNSFDLVISYSAIDHLDDYKNFIKESYRILKPGGQLLVSSHLDKDIDPKDVVKKSLNPFGYSFWERFSRYRYVRQHFIGSDDHTLHIESSEPISTAMSEVGFNITDEDVFKRYFYVLAEKP